MSWSWPSRGSKMTTPTKPFQTWPTFGTHIEELYEFSLIKVFRSLIMVCVFIKTSPVSNYVIFSLFSENLNKTQERELFRNTVMISNSCFLMILYSNPRKDCDALFIQLQCQNGRPCTFPEYKIFLSLAVEKNL